MNHKKWIPITAIILLALATSAYGIMKIRNKMASQITTQQQQLDELNVFKNQ